MKYGPTMDKQIAISNWFHSFLCIFRNQQEAPGTDMLRRKPTRIDVKLDNLEEYEALKKEKEQKAAQNNSKVDTAVAGPSNAAGEHQKTKQEIIHERIGYNPEPLPQPSRLPIH